MGLIIGIAFVIAIIIAVGMYYSESAKKSNEDTLAVLKIMDHSNHFAANIPEAKTIKLKIKNAEQALQMLNQASLYPNYREIISNYDDTVEKLEAMIKVLPIAEHIEKAEKNRFKKKDALEKNNLLDALFEIRNKDITDNDFENAMLHDEKTGEIVTIGAIEERLKELGWED